MFPQFFYFKLLLLFLCRLLLGKLSPNDADGTLRRSGSSRCQRFSSLVHWNDLPERVVVFDVEGALLRTTSLFPYFMVVAFEAGSLLRAVLLLLVYPVVVVLREDMALKVMVMVSFFGLREDTFRVGSGVLPKHFLEDVGAEGFDVIRKGGKKVGVTSLPKVMVESFLRDYMDIDAVAGRELKVFHGYYVGMMEEKSKISETDDNDVLLKEIDDAHKASFGGLRCIGINTRKRSARHPLFTRCEEMYIVSREDKKNWHELPRQSYPRSLIFHDGRLAIKPTPSTFLALLMWFPLGLLLSLLRAIVGLFLPYSISIPTLAFSGLRLTVSNPKGFSPLDSSNRTKAGFLYVCNHRTLLDPLYLSFTLKRDFTAVTYSLSRVSEILSPIRTVRLTRNRQKDAKMMETLLNQGDLVVCPEGTTCREPYLLRFSPLFSEMSDNIIPVALDSSVSMFYGTTASGLKCFDPLFFLMDPSPTYGLRLLEKVSGMMSRCHESESSRFDIANRVQKEIGEALGFECTKLTRKDKYLTLAGNEGISKNRA
ncbi:hypothetical protein MLD38_032968 [Melastoma candidum]|uniref:Uncharacterized protein n=1 Tax=Melastoma candidum TaxID=119954 RepID=A0ACB9M514_9MYRT|nr:hypothetical protein MLD38_032968 [Melastoma candidum]